MKRVIVLMLCVLCVFSLFSMPSFAEEEITETRFINYNLNGGKNSAANPTEFASPAGMDIFLEGATKAGYTFDGWYADSAFAEKVDYIPEGTCEDVNLFAKWTAHSYTIKFSGNGGSGTMPTYTGRVYGKTYTLPANQYKRAGYVFTGWNTKKDGSGKAYENRAQVKNLTTKDGGTVTFYAQWAPNHYTIKFNGNGASSGTMPTYTERTYGKTYTLPANKYKKTGYTFVGWNTKKDGSGTSYDNKATVKNMTTKDGGTATFYAQWAPNHYTLKFNGNGGSGTMPTYTGRVYGKTYTLPANKYKKTGYTFVNWNTKKDGTGTAYGNKSTVKNLTAIDGRTVTLYAQWERTGLIAPAFSKTASAKSDSITISWTKNSEADGYYLYRKISGGSYSKIKIIKDNATVSYTDSVSAGVYTYAIASYKKVGSETLTGAKSESITVRTLGKTSNVTSEVSSQTPSSDANLCSTISWKKVTGATSYQVQKRLRGATAWTACGTSTTNSKVVEVAHGKYYDFRVRPIYEKNGVKTYGAYVVSSESWISYYNPVFTTWMSSETDSRATLIAVRITNNGKANMRVYSANAYYNDADYDSFDRDLRLVSISGNTISYVSYIDIPAGSSDWAWFAVDGNATWYDERGHVYFKFTYDNMAYYCGASSKYGHTFVEY